MDDFGWNWKDLEKKGLLKIVRKEPFSMTTSIEAMAGYRYYYFWSCIGWVELASLHLRTLHNYLL